MKFLYPLLVFLGFSLAGYLFYPSVSGVHAAPGSTSGTLPNRAATSGAELADIPAADFPDKVTLKIAVVVYSKDRQTSFELPAGQMVTPVRIEQGMLVVQPGTSPLEGEVAVTATDFLEKVAAKRAATPALATPVGEAAAVVDPAPVVDPVVEAAPAVEPVAAEPVAVEPAVVEPAVVEPAVVEPAVVEPAVVESAVVEPAASGAGVGVDATVLVALMKASVAAGAVTEFKAADVSSWEATAEEVIDGQTYQTGLAVYETNGPFGVSTVRAKALIQGGKVIRWIGAKSGLELK